MSNGSHPARAGLREQVVSALQRALLSALIDWPDQVTAFTGSERRWRCTDEERLQIVAEALAPGVRIAAVGRRHDVSDGLIYALLCKLPDAEVALGAKLPKRFRPRRSQK